MTLPEFIRTARARCDAATEGPWFPYCDYEMDLHWLCNDKDTAHVVTRDAGEEIASATVVRDPDEEMDIHPRDKERVAGNVTFIAHARTDLPRALDALAKALALLEAAKDRLRCNYDGDCSGCALDSEIDLFLECK